MFAVAFRKKRIGTVDFYRDGMEWPSNVEKAHHFNTEDEAATCKGKYIGEGCTNIYDVGICFVVDVLTHQAKLGLNSMEGELD